MRKKWRKKTKKMTENDENPKNAKKCKIPKTLPTQSKLTLFSDCYMKKKYESAKDQKITKEGECKNCGEYKRLYTYGFCM
jgi:hypothetical protein